MGASTRDLDGWADALGVTDDDSGSSELVRLIAKADVAGDSARELARLLRGMPEAIAMQAATRYLDEVATALMDAAVGFERHERGSGR